MCYTIQKSKIWTSFVFLLSWIYVILTAFEPRNKLDNQYIVKWELQFSINFAVELVILTVWTLDCIFQIAHNWEENIFNEFINY